MLTLLSREDEGAAIVSLSVLCWKGQTDDDDSSPATQHRSTPMTGPTPRWHLGMNESRAECWLLPFPATGLLFGHHSASSRPWVVVGKVAELATDTRTHTHMST